MLRDGMSYQNPTELRKNEPSINWDNIIVVGYNELREDWVDENAREQSQLFRGVSNEMGNNKDRRISNKSRITYRLLFSFR